MKRFYNIASGMALSAVLSFTSLGAAAAMPLPAISAPQAQSQNVEQVQYRYYRRHHGRHHRQYRHYRHYHRHHHSNAGAIIGGLAAGAIIGGVLATPRRSYGGSHVQWCSNRYRTYRASDNTYVPRVGVRAYCNSPYN
ncbi:BA14K family protein [Rhizobium halophytocola]|uniref:Lectin-like protein BA14k n=1 Tax=Rhizobium halophytocola TaxID=735519 RepID=A0ABS4E1U9_9HYPH|nr:BA14K family protein [Rhizobium halophytocola]MBP1851913.1 hypothetical protein [Rhizobium halophytocola]